MFEVADVLRRYGPEYLQTFQQRMPSEHRRAIRDLLQCRTPALGGHVFACDHCGKLQYSYHSCRNRSCPKCHTSDTQAWLEARQKDLLPVPYYHVIFTVPHELNVLARRHRKEVYGLLIQSAGQSLVKLAADPHYVGGRVGVMAVLHTWGSNLAYHLHVHCLVTGGGLAEDGQTWMPARGDYLVPVQALSRLFRGQFLDRIHRQFPALHLPDCLWHKDWVVHCKPAVQGIGTVLAYLARYIHRVAITNSRILSIEDGRVTFRYRPTGTPETKTMTVSATEFIRRFLQHVLPAKVHKVRYYGLWSPTHRKHLRAMQQLLAEPVAEEPEEPQDDPDPQAPAPPEARPCPYCQIGMLIWIRRLPRQGRAPP